MVRSRRPTPFPHRGRAAATTYVGPARSWRTTCCRPRNTSTGFGYRDGTSHDTMPRRGTFRHFRNAVAPTATGGGATASSWTFWTSTALGRRNGPTTKGSTPPTPVGVGRGPRPCPAPARLGVKTVLALGTPPCPGRPQGRGTPTSPVTGAPGTVAVWGHPRRGHSLCRKPPDGQTAPQEIPPLGLRPVIHVGPPGVGAAPVAVDVAASSAAKVALRVAPLAAARHGPPPVPHRTRVTGVAEPYWVSVSVSQLDTTA